MTTTPANETFPPRPSRPSEVAACVEAFASVVAGRSATYVSSPLTTGQLAFEWHQRNGGAGTPPDDAEFRRAVIHANRDAASAYVARLRTTTEAVVIDPTAVADIPDWTQSDYRFFWGVVIERYAETVIVRDGWEHSNGCAYELLVACANGLRVLREDLEPLSADEARRLLRSVIEARASQPDSAVFLTRVVDALEELVATRDAR